VTEARRAALERLDAERPSAPEIAGSPSVGRTDGATPTANAGGRRSRSRRRPRPNGQSVDAGLQTELFARASLAPEAELSLAQPDEAPGEEEVQ
jgi:hypothetical protein